MQLDHDSITFILGLSTAVGIIFSVYLYFRNPQIDGEKDAIRLTDRILNLEKSVIEIKETHLRSVENDIKSLTAAVNELGRTVIKLSTVIDERIPRMTPPGK